jgi:hypothetical protein
VLLEALTWARESARNGTDLGERERVLRWALTWARENTLTWAKLGKLACCALVAGAEARRWLRRTQNAEANAAEAMAGARACARLCALV